MCEQAYVCTDGYGGWSDHAAWLVYLVVLLLANSNDALGVLFNLLIDPRPIELQLLKPRSIKTLIAAQLKATSLLLIINY